MVGGLLRRLSSTALRKPAAPQLHLGDVLPPRPPPGGPPRLGFGDANWRRSAAIAGAVGTVIWLLPIRWAYDTAVGSVAGLFQGLEEVRAKKAVLEGLSGGAVVAPEAAAAALVAAPAPAALAAVPEGAAVPEATGAPAAPTHKKTGWLW